VTRKPQHLWGEKDRDPEKGERKVLYALEGGSILLKRPPMLEENSNLGKKKKLPSSSRLKTKDRALSREELHAVESRGRRFF